MNIHVPTPTRTDFLKFVNDRIPNFQKRSKRKSFLFKSIANNCLKIGLKMSQSETLILFHIVKKMYLKYGQFFIISSYRKLARDLKMSPPTIFASIKKLEINGLIFKLIRPKTNKTLVICFVDAIIEMFEIYVKCLQQWFLKKTTESSLLLNLKCDIIEKRFKNSL